MINTRKFGGGYFSPSYIIQKGGKALILVSFTDFQKGGLRWNNISDKGGDVNG